MKDILPVFDKANKPRIILEPIGTPVISVIFQINQIGEKRVNFDLYEKSYFPPYKPKAQFF